MKVLFMISAALVGGLLMSRVIKPLKLPAVTAYLVAGILLGPFCLGSLGVEGLGFSSHESVASLAIISEVALGFIAFQIGNEFRLTQLRQIGRQALIIGVLQAFVATLAVDAALVGLHFIFPEQISLATALTLGAIASATAPAATMMVVRQYKAKGPLTDLLLPIVAIDDAVGLVIFAVSFGIAKALHSGSVDLLSIVVNPIVEIVASLVLGFLLGALLTYVEKFFHSRSKRMSLSLTFVFLTVALTMMEFQIGGVTVAFSSLLTCMMLGTAFCNLCDFSEELMERTENWTTPLFILFFVISGAELDLTVFTNGIIVLAGVCYIAARSLGKYFGAFFSSALARCTASVKKYLGVALLPQAGVALGMSLTASHYLAEDGALIRSITLFAVLVYEIFGPVLTKIALTRAGDINPANASSARVKNKE